MPEYILQMFIRAAQAAPSADNSQPYRYRWDGKRLSITYDTDRVAGATFSPLDPATLLSLGCILENIHQVGQALGLSIGMHFEPDVFDKMEIEVVLPSSEFSFTLKKALQLPLFERHTNRFAYSNSPLSVNTIETIADHRQANASLRIVQDNNDIRTIAGLIRLASIIRFNTQEAHEWLGKSLRFEDQQVSQGDGLDVSTLDLPPGGRQFLRFTSSWPRMRVLNRLGASKFMATIDAAPIKKASSIVAISGENSPQGAIDAGRVLERAWIDLNQRGLAVHPYYVIADQVSRFIDGSLPPAFMDMASSVIADANELLHISSNYRLYMLLRVGEPRKNPKRSLRLGSRQVFDQRAT